MCHEGGLIIAYSTQRDQEVFFILLDQTKS